LPTVEILITLDVELMIDLGALVRLADIERVDAMVKAGIITQEDRKGELMTPEAVFRIWLGLNSLLKLPV
jgi:hypothetical protein